MASASTALDAFDAAFAAAQLAEEEYLVSRELEEISSRSRPQPHDLHRSPLPPAHPHPHHPHQQHPHQQHFSASTAHYARAGGVACESCSGRGVGLHSTTAPLAASGARGSGGLISAAAAAAPSWCVYCGCSQVVAPTAAANGQCASCSPHRRAVQTLQRGPASEPHRRGAYFEAEDAAAYPDATSARHRSGQYYSPPGTSYTIVEARPSARDLPLREIGFRPINARAASQSPPVRQSASASRGAAKLGSSGGAAISPEQVIRMLNSSNHGVGAGGPGGVKARDQPPPPINMMNNMPVRTVTMSRPAESAHGFGICVKGGRESGVGVYISRVEENSVAEHVGLRPGDSILEVNGMPFGGVSHDEALKMLKTCRKVTMTVRSASGGAGYALPSASASAGAGQLYTWTDRHGRPVSPPPEYASALSGPPPLPPPGPGARTWNFHSARSKERTRKVELSIEPGQSLGLMIRGGVEYGLGVFVTGVDPGSVAERCGLMVGDQILEVNGQSFMAVTHDEAVSQLKYHKRMSLIVRDVGKVPSSGAPHTASSGLLGHAWETHLPHTSRSPAGWQRNLEPSGAALQMVQEKARVILPHPEYASLDYYQREYAARQMDVEAFVAVLLEMLNTPEKYTLLIELREVVRPEDRARFDELVYRREAEGQRCRELRDLLGHRGGQDHLRELRANGSRRHSSPGVDQEGDPGADPGANRSQYDANGAMVVPDMQGNLRITVKKCKPMLGIAIEGGANTKHPLPRIINIHENGAAYEAGGLEVGQLILEVDGHKVEGMHHQEVARLIAESFAARSRPEIEFLVVEAKKSNLEAKPTALIFLEA
ncbi:whirlin isoform X7 [Cloeon dipterum]|uniref:whirlin isoform X7 n=1 Tax=Cloeon dipterum TaxID=197152 RepID=UPI00321F831C